MEKTFVREFEQLTVGELYDILRLRAEVFVVEQNCVYQDVDNNDQAAVHFSTFVDKKLVAYARVLPPRASGQSAWHIGRVIVAATARGNGYAKGLMNVTMEYIAANNTNKLPVLLMAQTYLRNFYAAFGFEARGEEFLEDGIPHVNMYLK
ncbi:MAG: GNAT family N-acetyltransferase [Schleiferiaceae bacterium]|nr:GNAT family N-acetyltransferase [Schleiferiaceae bacterium]